MSFGVKATQFLDFYVEDETVTRKDLADYFIPTVWVSKDFRDYIAGAFTELSDNESYWRLMQHIIFHVNYNNIDEEDAILIPQMLLAVFENKQADVLNKNYNASKFLDDFKRKVLPNMQYTKDWSYAENKARMITNNGLSEDVQNRINDELTNRKKEVAFTTGKTMNKVNIAAERKLMKQTALTAIDFANNDDTRAVIDYMNNLDINIFTKTMNNTLDNAFAYVGRNYDGLALKRVTTLLKKIDSYPQQLYKTATKSTRIFGLNECLTNAPKEIRRILTPDWVEFDLTNAQLAIFAGVYDVTELNEFLKQGTSIWKYLVQWFKDNDYDASGDEIKKVLKKTLYSMLFYKGIDGLEKQWYSLFDKHVSDDRYIPFELFINNPIIKLIKKARNQVYSNIITSGGAFTAQGKFLSTKDYSIRSIAAQVMQSYEISLLKPVIDLANTTDEFKVTLWQHDGFSIYYRQEHRKMLWESRIIAVVNKKIKEYGFITRLAVAD